MKNQFNIERFISVLKHDLLLNLRIICIVLAASIGIMALVHTIGIVSMNKNNVFVNPELMHYIIYFIFLLMLGLTISGMAFPGLRSKEKAQNYLTLPASSFEKYLSMWMLLTIGLTLSFGIIYWSLAVIVNKIGTITTDIWFFPFSFTHPKYLLFTGIYIVVQSVFFMGAVSLKRLPILHTHLYIFFINLFLAAIGLLSFLIIFGVFPWKKGAWFNYINPSDSFAYFIKETLPLILKYIFWYVIAPLFWFIAFLKLKEKEV